MMNAESLCASGSAMVNKLFPIDDAVIWLEAEDVNTSEMSSVTIYVLFLQT